MSEGAGDVVRERLAAARGTAESADGLIRVEMDAAGEVLELVIEPKAMRLPSADLAAAVKGALATARERAREQLAQDPPVSPMPGLDQVQRTLTELGVDAQRRLGEFAAMAQQIAARLDSRQ